jgi:hypothetical protein
VVVFVNGLGFLHTCTDTTGENVPSRSLEAPDTDDLEPSGYFPDSLSSSTLAIWELKG